MEFDRTEIQQRWQEMYTEGQLWIPYWRDQKEWLNPTRGRFEGELPQNVRKTDHRKILNNKARIALRTAAAGLHSGLTSPSRPWFRLTVGDPDLSEDSQVRQWLDLIEKRMFAVLASSNIYKVFPTLYAELLQFGTAASIIEEDFDHVIWGRTMTCGQYYLSTDDKGKVNAFGRKFEMTVLQLVRRFGIENCPEQVKKLYEDNKLSGYQTVIHVIEENDNRIPNQNDFKNKAYRSVYWCPIAPKEEVLSLGGYDEFPVMAPRWEVTTTSDVYGTSPGEACMGDQKSLQKMERDGMVGLAKVVDPPVTSSGTSKNINTAPGGVNAYDPVASTDSGVKAAYQVQIDFNTLAKYIQRVESRIDVCLFTDLFRMILDVNQPQPITAREVVEKHEEKMMNLGPVLESMNQELHAPLIRRLFNIMNRGKLIPPPPPQMQKQLLKVDFISILAQAQQMVATTSIQQSLGFIGSMAGLFPDIVDVVDADESAIEYMQANGMPAKCIRGKDQIAAMRNQKAKQMEAAQQQQQAMAMVQGAKTLSDSKMDGNNALSAIMGQPGGAI